MTSSEKPLVVPDLSSAPSCRAEWAALLECASPTSNAQRFGELASTVDWTRLLALAQEHAVIGHLATRLSELDENIVRADERSALVELHRTQVFRTLAMIRELF